MTRLPHTRARRVREPPSLRRVHNGDDRTYAAGGPGDLGTLMPPQELEELGPDSVEFVVRAGRVRGDTRSCLTPAQATARFGRSASHMLWPQPMLQREAGWATYWRPCTIKRAPRAIGDERLRRDSPKRTGGSISLCRENEDEKFAGVPTRNPKLRRD